MRTDPLITTLRTNMRRALRERKTGDAEQILAHLKREDPLSATTRGFELELYLASNRLSEAQALARQLCRLFPSSGRIVYLAGRIAYRLKRYDEAEAHLRESQRIHPHWRVQRWLGKTLTQAGRFDEAESLLLPIREHSVYAWLDLAWLYERRGELDEALDAYDRYLAVRPDDEFAVERRLQVKARLLEPESLIREASTLEALGEDISDALFPEYVKKLFETGNTNEARRRIMARMPELDAKAGSNLAWVCYRAQAYDLACTLFLAHLADNLGYHKYLNALEAAAVKCGRIPQVLEKYGALSADAPRLHGRAKALTRRSSQP